MSAEKPRSTYRADYRPPDYWIDTVDLHFDLGEEQTIVTARLAVRRGEVRVGDVIGLGSSTFLLRAPDELERRNEEGNMTVEVRDLTIDVPGKRLIESTSFVIYPGELVGLMGPSGCT